MNIHFNPFTPLLETRAFPHAKTLRSGFLEKITEAFLVTFGRGDKKGGQENFTLGVVDYLTFGLLLAVSISCDWCRKNRENNVLAKLLYYPSQVGSALSMISRIFLSIVIAIIALPIITFVHVVSLFIVKNIFSKALDLQGEYTYLDTSTRVERGGFLANITNPYDHKTVHGTLRDALEKNNIRLQSSDKLNLSCKMTNTDLSTPGIELFFYKGTFFKTTLASDDKKSQQAFFHLNLFGATAAMEAAGYLPETNSAIRRPNLL